MRALRSLLFSLAVGLLVSSGAVAQPSARSRWDVAESDWQAWRGRDVVELTAQLGEPDRRTARRLEYDALRIGSPDGPYRVWQLRFGARAGRVTSVRAVLVASIGCELTE